MSDFSIGLDIGLYNMKFGFWNKDEVMVFSDYAKSLVTLKDNNVRFNEDKFNKNLQKYIIYDINKIIGKKFNDKEIQENMKNWPFKIEKDLKTELPLIIIENKGEIKKYFPEEIVMMLFDGVERVTNSYFFTSIKIKNIVLTIPLYFNELQKKSYINSAKKSGLNILKLIKTTSATALTYYDYNIKTIKKSKKNILIFDLGITLEISIFSIDENRIEEKASYYDINYGGNNILNELVELCINDFKDTNEIGLHNNEKAILKLKRECEKIIQNFSYSYNHEITLSIDWLYEDYDFNKYITQYDLIINFKKIIESIKNVLQKAKINKDNIDDIFFKGGLSLNPLIQECVLNFFKIKKKNSNCSYHAAAYGAVIQLSILNQKYYNNNLTLL